MRFRYNSQFSTVRKLTRNESENIFDRLIEEKNQEYITIQIKDKFKTLFFDLKDNFSKHELDEIINIKNIYEYISVCTHA